ncbi:MAG TPA: DUF362 domain-containing protein [Kiritimatiellia bacterium]|nr:DUF362 domain-containing protein [Kiritimatiellia bacterium]HMP33450.1 DUF362 domain-containing protein [Kiritimatiellia bacterium]
MSPTLDPRASATVAVAWTDPAYPRTAPFHPDRAYPEYDGPVATTPNGVYDAVRAALRDLGLDTARFGTPEWNPIGALVPPGAKIVIKPNWVLHENEGPGGRACLYTHASVVRPLIDYALKARPAQLVVGDAPVQVCDLPSLLTDGFNDLFAFYRARGVALVTKDFRRTVSARKPGSLEVSTEQKPLSDYVLVDLATRSLLEPISPDAEKFRVTMYNPEALRDHHAPGRHRYLVARDILEADLVINAPKLKTHMKAGVTLALKNLVGINGSKEFLPHHRKGAANRGGDNYARQTLPKRALEGILDWLNRHHLDKPRLYGRGARLAYKLLWLDKIRGEPVNVEGGWHGNDTVWRMCLDLNKILLFADTDGRLHDTPQRATLHVTDGVIAGDGEGPLRPDPVPFGGIVAALNPAAHDWVTTRLMSLDPAAIPIVRRAFDPVDSGLIAHPPDALRVTSGGTPVALEDLARARAFTFQPAAGWRGHCEINPAPEHPGGSQPCAE